MSSLIAEALTASNDTQDVLLGGSTRLSAEGRGEEVDVMAYDAMPRSAASRGLKSAARQVGLRPASLARREMMIVSKAYYIEHKSKVEIAEELGMSRFRVARLLAQAEECGVVTHTLNSGGMITELSEAVAHHLNIHHANVLEVYGDVPSVRTAVGRAIGLYMRDIIEDGEVLGIGWGRTLNAMFDDLDELPNVEIRLLTGHNAGDKANSARRLLRRALALTGGPGYPFPAPFFINDARTANALRQQPNVASTLAGFSRITTAVVTINAADTESGAAFLGFATSTIVSVTRTCLPRRASPGVSGQSPPTVSLTFPGRIVQMGAGCGCGRTSRVCLCSGGSCLCGGRFACAVARGSAHAFRG